MFSFLLQFISNGGPLGFILALSLLALLLRFFDYILFNSRPPPGSDADARCPDEAQLAAELEAHFATAAEEEVARMTDHLRSSGSLPPERGASPHHAHAAPVSRKPRGPPPTGSDAPPSKLSDLEARTQLKRFAESDFLRNVLGSSSAEEDDKSQ